MFGRLGWAEILIIVVLIFILFGHNKIPQMMKNVANGLKVFKNEMKADDKKAVKSNDAVSAKKVPAKKSVATKKTTTKKIKTENKVVKHK